MFHVQHADDNVGPGNYKHLAPNELLVSKIFYTIQGEGPYAGWPAIFIRLAGCNRGDKTSSGCQFCDTNFIFKEGIALTFDKILDIMKTRLDGELDATNLGKPLVVITGGEPMLQDNLVPFIQLLLNLAWLDIQIESNGDRLAKNFLDLDSSVTLVVSPKAALRRTPPFLIKPDVFNRLDVLKILIDSRGESPYHDIPDFAFHVHDAEVYLSPITVYRRSVGIETASMWDPTLVSYQGTRLNYERAARLALWYGFKVSMQQHLFWGVD